jgi:hypothetical protein
MLCRVTLVRTDVSKERSASFIRVTRIGELGTKLVFLSGEVFIKHSHIVFLRSLRRLLVTADVPSSPILVTLMTERNIPEGGILHSHRSENFESYIFISTVFASVLLFQNNV